MVTPMKFEKKFGNKMYKAVYVQWGSMDKGYGGEFTTKAKAMKKAEMLRGAGFSARVQREIHLRYPKRGPELFYVVYARKDGLALDQVVSEARRLFEW